MVTMSLWKLIGLADLFNVFIGLCNIIDKEKSTKFDNPNIYFSDRNKGLLIDGNKYRISEKDSFEHLALISPTSKTEEYVIPNIFNLSKNKCSIIVNDPSGEVYQLTSQYMFQKGFNILCIDPNNNSISAKYNPLKIADTSTKIEKLTNILLEQGKSSLNKKADNNPSMYSMAGKELIRIISKCLNNKDDKLNNLVEVYEILKRFKNDGTSIDPLIKKYAPDNRTESDWNVFKNMSNDAISHAKDIIRGVLDITVDFPVEQLLSSSSFSFEDINSKKTIVYLRQPLSEQYRFIFDLFYTQLFDFLIEKDERKKKSGLPIYFFIDGFCNLSIPDLEKTLSVIGGYRVSISAILQSYNQLKEKFNSSTAETIWNSMNSKLIYSKIDLETAELIEKLLGEVIKKNFCTGIVVSTESLMKANNIQKMSDEIFIRTGSNPVKINCCSYSNTFHFLRWSKKGAFR